jgi:hypothetical protein
MRIFYDLIHDLDDGGWYAVLFNQAGVELCVTDTTNSRESTITAVKSKYPNAELLKEF